MKYTIGNTNGAFCSCCNTTHAYCAIIELNDPAEVNEHLAAGIILRHHFDPETMNLEGTLTPEEAELQMQQMMNPG